MTEYWKSQEHHFCKYCKCWINDNPISRQVHENGVRHKKNVEDKLSELRRKQTSEAKQTKDEAHWLKKMEEAALKDYKKKDITNNRDFTAKLYNNEDLPDIDEKYESIRGMNQVGPKLPDEPEPKHMKFEKMLKAGEAGSKEINPVKASTSGTPWHNPGPPKYWYEAKNEEGHSYFWNTNTKESRWEAPVEGYVTIEEQEKIQQDKDNRLQKKAELIEKQREKFSRPKPEAELEPAKVDPYGGKGWQTVEAPAPAPKLDLGLPAPRVDKTAPVIQIQKPEKKEIVFKEKTVESLGGGSGSSASSGIKPTITFRKRKNQSIRQRDEES